MNEIDGIIDDIWAENEEILQQTAENLGFSKENSSDRLTTVYLSVIFSEEPPEVSPEILDYVKKGMRNLVRTGFTGGKIDIPGIEDLTTQLM